MNRKKVTVIIGGAGVAALIATAGSAYTAGITFPGKEVVGYVPFSATPNSGPSSSSSSVDWENYSPDLKDRIDRARDCEALQKELDNVADKDKALKTYIDQKLKAAECTPPDTPSR